MEYRTTSRRLPPEQTCSDTQQLTISLCAGLFVVGRWMDHGGGDASKDFLDSVLKWLFYVVGFFLTFINFEYGLHQIELMRLPNWWRAVAFLVVLQCGGFTILYLGSPNKSEATIETIRGNVAETREMVNCCVSEQV